MKMDFKNKKSKNLFNESMSRRAFINKTGKIVGLGLLAHFSLIGQIFADETKKKTNNREKCSNNTHKFVCEVANYTCSATNIHQCNTQSAFDCQGQFSCAAPTPNQSNCYPTHFNIIE